MLADLEQAERRVERVARQARGGDRAAIAEEAWLREVIDALQAGRPARSVPRAGGGAERGARPRLADGQAGAVRRQRRRGLRRGARARSPRTPRRRARARSRSPRASSPSWRSSTTRTRRRCARSSASSESGLAARRARGLRAARADRVLHRRRGQAGAVVAPAPRPRRRGTRPGEIHSDIQKGFVRAEVIGWQELRRRRRLRGRARPRHAAPRGPRLRDGRRRRDHRQVHAVAQRCCQALARRALGASRRMPSSRAAARRRRSRWRVGRRRRRRSAAAWRSA